MSNIAENIHNRKNILLGLIIVATPSVIVQLILGVIPFLNFFFMSHFFPKDTPSSNVMSVITPAFWLLNAFCFFPIMGTSVGYTMLLGQKKYKEANNYANSGFFLGLCSSVIIVLIAWFAFKPFIKVISHNNAEVSSYAIHMIHASILGYPLMVTAFYMAFMIRNAGWIWKSLLSFVLLIIIIIASGFLLLTFAYNKDINKGFSLIGYSNAIGYASVFIATISYLHLKSGLHFRININREVFTIKPMIRVLKMGSSSLANNMGTTFISLITNLVFAWLIIPDLASRVSPVNGSDIHALKNTDYWQFIFGSILPIWILFLNPTYGINAASRLMLAYQYSVKNVKRINDLIKYSVILNLVYFVFIEFIILILGSQLVNIFGIHNGVIKEFAGSSYSLTLANNDCRLILGIIGLFYFSYAMPAINLGMAQVLHRTLLANFSAIQRPVIIEVIVVAISGAIAFHMKDPWFFWWSYPIMDLISLTVGILIFRSLQRQISNPIDIDVINIKGKNFLKIPKAKK